MRVLVTRMQPDAGATAKRVRDHGAEAIVAPLIEYVPGPFDTDLSGVQVLLFTSANGVRAFADATSARDRAVLTVGDATAEAARAAGFTRVRSAGGDVAALAALASEKLKPEHGRLLYISGADIARDLVEQLTGAGFAAERRIAYEARAVDKLPELPPYDVALFHSARAASIFATLGAPHAGQARAGCLSPAVAEAAAKTGWLSLIVASAPREEALLQAVFRP